MSFTGLAGRAALFVALWLAATAVPAADVPYLSGRVVDEAEILSPAARERLVATSKAHEDRTTNQVVVLTVPSIGGESIEEYANRVFSTWKLGQQGKDNGVLVLVVPNDRKMRIEVGYGLEGTLPDVDAARIIRNRITPRFKAGDFDGGVTDGIDAIVAQLEGRPGASGDAGGTTLPHDRQGYLRLTADSRVRRATAAVAIAHPARRIHLRDHRPLHRPRRGDAGHGLVPLCVPDSVLGDVPHHRCRG